MQSSSLSVYICLYVCLFELIYCLFVFVFQLLPYDDAQLQKQANQAAADVVNFVILLICILDL